MRGNEPPPSLRPPDGEIAKTRQNLRTAFAEEAKAHRRLLAFARKADEEDLPSIARLFRAVAFAEGVHADASLRLLGEAVVRTTEENLEASLARETGAAHDAYSLFIRDAEQEGDRRAARVFSMTRDAESSHASAYKRALECMVSESECRYWVCQVCGYVSAAEPPESCPVCGVSREHWALIE